MLKSTDFIILNGFDLIYTLETLEEFLAAGCSVCGIKSIRSSGSGMFY